MQAMNRLLGVSLVTLLTGVWLFAFRRTTDVSARRLRSHHGDDKQSYSLLRPNPEFLVWDNVTYENNNKTYMMGWLNVPLYHDSVVSQFEAAPRFCLRVRVLPAIHQPAKNGPLMLHCGGPGSGKRCVDKFAKLGLIELLGNDRIVKNFDVWSIDQRGVVETSNSSDTTPPCPFVQNEKQVQPYPKTYCNELLSMSKSEVISRLGVHVTDEDWDKFISPIIKNRELPGIDFKNEQAVRWYYRLVSLSHNLCYKADRYQVASATNGRKFNLLDFTGTTDLAYDIDLFRSAIGSPRMSLWGASYGTYVAGVYATIFSDRVFRVILDGVVSPLPDVAEMSTQFARGASGVWEGLASACDNSFAQRLPPGEICPAAPGATSKVLSLISNNKSGADLFYKLTVAPLYTTDVPDAASTMACIQLFYSEVAVEGCPFSDLINLTAEELTEIQDAMKNLTADNTDTSNNTITAPLVNNTDDLFLLGVQASVLGLDVAGRFDEESYIVWWRDTLRQYPLGTAWALGWATLLGTWPAIPSPVPPLGSAVVAPLIVGNLHDPNTPYHNAQLMKEMFPQSSMVTWQGYGHCTHGPRNDGFSAMNEYIEALKAGKTPEYTLDAAKLLCTSLLFNYIAEGKLPADGHVCRVPGPVPLGSIAAIASLNSTGDARHDQKDQAWFMGYA
jgi:pimeloyl-ACP methyl ester carboxylesterase